MKKLFLMILGLASFNAYANGCGGEYQAATRTCRIIDGSGREILYNIPPQSGNTAPPPKKSSITMFLCHLNLEHLLTVRKQGTLLVL